MSRERLVFLAAKREDHRSERLFPHYAGDDKACFTCWQQVAEAEKHLADDFMDAVSSGDI